MPLMSAARHHAEWLSLAEVSGPFLSVPVLVEAFPAGLEKPARLLRDADCSQRDHVARSSLT
jgi:hypothetical protein